MLDKYLFLAYGSFEPRHTLRHPKFGVAEHGTEGALNS